MKKLHKRTLNHKDFSLLGKIFAAEIGGVLPYQSKSKEYDRLEGMGLVQCGEETRHFNDGFPPMQIIGWYLTHKGRYMYCSNCDEVDE
jgi:hypothetical protein